MSAAIVTVHRATCGGCRAVLPRGDALKAATAAAAHEQETGHTVTLWDSPTSQLPRSVWHA